MRVDLFPSRKKAASRCEIAKTLKKSYRHEEKTAPKDEDVAMPHVEGWFPQEGNWGCGPLHPRD